MKNVIDDDIFEVSAEETAAYLDRKAETAKTSECGSATEITIDDIEAAHEQEALERERSGEAGRDFWELEADYHEERERIAASTWHDEGEYDSVDDMTPEGMGLDEIDWD